MINYYGQFLKKAVLFIIIFKIILQKQLVGNYISTQYLTQSKYYIKENSQFSIVLWFRILKNIQTTNETVVLQIKNNSNQFINLILLNQNELILKDEQDSIIQTDWPAPFEQGYLDIQNQAIIYTKWLPIVISRNISNTVYLLSYDNLSMYNFLQKDFNLNSSTYLDLKPNNLNDYEIVFENVIYLNLLIDQQNLLKDYIYDNGYLGMYFLEARSKNDQILFNLNRKNQYKDQHIYIEQINPLISRQTSTFTRYTLHMPNFFNSRVYYISQYFYELYLYFDENFNNAQIQETNTHHIYYRILNYQQKYFSFQLNMQFDITSNNISLNKSIEFHSTDTSIILNTQNQTFQSDQWYRTEKLQAIVFIQCHPQSTFINLNKIKLISHLVNVKVEQDLSVDFIYSYYDQIQVKDDQQKVIKFLLSTAFDRIIFYRSTILIEEDLSTQATSKFNIYFGNQRFLKFYFDTSIDYLQRFSNVDINYMTDIIESEAIQYDYKLNLCYQLIPFCQFCVEGKCLRCTLPLQLVDNTCLRCQHDYLIFKNQCLQKQRLYPQNQIESDLLYEQDILKEIYINLRYFASNTSIDYTEQGFYSFIQSQEHLDQIKTQISSHLSLDNIRIMELKVYYLKEFGPDYNGICNPNKYFITDSNFQTQCVTACSTNQIIQQKRFCVQDILGCEINDGIKCLKCQSNYQQLLDQNNKIYCVVQNLIPSQNYDLTQRTYQLNPIQNCQIGTNDLKCIQCDTGYMINKTDRSCTLINTFYTYQTSYKLCSKYNNEDTVDTCIGTYSDTYIQGTYNSKWSYKCNILDSYYKICSSCTDPNYQLTSLQTCEKCLDLNTATNQCLSCDVNMQIVNGQCRQQLCLELIQNCISCNENNMLLCQECSSGYVLVNNNDYQACYQQISNCSNYIYQDEQIQCSQCQQEYLTLDIDLNVSQSGLICYIKQYYLENCSNYNSSQICTSCKTNFTLLDQYFCLPNNSLIDQCQNYNNQSLVCTQCNTNYICFDDNFVQSEQYCYYCFNSNLLVQNCYKYNIEAKCTECLYEYFLYEENLVQSCINSQYYVENCIKYSQEIQKYICVLCLNNLIPQNNTCFIQIQGQVYIKEQQIYIFSENQIENCIKYDQLQTCIQCQAEYYLTQEIVSQSLRSVCYKNLIKKCLIYLRESQCKKCVENYNFTQDLNQCIYVENCKQGYCYNLEQQIILYQQVINNCLLEIENCISCENSNYNNCQLCKENYQLKDNKCEYQCNFENNSQIDYQKYCQSSNENQYQCSNIFQNCSICEIQNSSIVCIKCDQFYSLIEEKCIKNKFLEIIDDKNPIIHSPQQQATNCLEQQICFKQNQLYNKHCTKCKRQCNLFLKNYSIITNDNIQYKLLEEKQDFILYYLNINYQKAQINIQPKDYYQSLDINIKSKSYLEQTINCIPSEIYNFKLKQFQPNKMNGMLQQQQTVINTVPSLVAIFSVEAAQSLFFFLNQTKIFQYLDFLSMQQGPIAENLKLKRIQNYQTQKDLLMQKMPKRNFQTEFIFTQYQIQVEFFYVFEGIEIYEVVFLFIIIFYKTLKMLLLYDNLRYQAYKISLKQTILGFIFCKILQFILDFLNQVKIIYLLYKEQFLMHFVVIIITLLSGYFAFYLIVKSIKIYYQEKIFYKQYEEYEKLQLQSESLVQKSQLKTFFEMFQISFLFIKLKFLFDFQDYNIFNGIFFIFINILELFKFIIYKQFKFLMKLYVIEVLSNATLILFCLIQLIGNMKQSLINSLFYNISFLLIFVFQVIMLCAQQITFKVKKLKQLNFLVTLFNKLSF